MVNLKKSNYQFHIKTKFNAAIYKCSHLQIHRFTNAAILNYMMSGRHQSGCPPTDLPYYLLHALQS